MAYPKLNILCVCSAGRVRAHSLRMFIADNYINTSVIAAGILDHKDVFLPVLLKIADVVIACSSKIEEQVYNKFGYRPFLIDIGNDIYTGSNDPILKNKIKALAPEIDLLISNERAMSSCRFNGDVVDE